MSVNIATFDGAPNGIVRAKSQHEIGDGDCWSVIDAFLNQPGYITRRAGLDTTIGSYSGGKMMGMAGAVDPAGTWAGVMLVKKTADSNGRLVGFKNSTISEDIFSTVPNALYFDAKDSLNGGTLIGVSDGINTTDSTKQALVLYRGATLPSPPSTYTPTVAVARGATSITVTANGADWCAGHFVFGSTSSQLIGTVRSVSGNVLTLEKPAVAAEASTIYGSAWRGLFRKVSKGRITTATTGAAVNGGDTLFRANGLATGTWDLFTIDLTYIGTVSSVESDTALTLTGSAAVALTNADYIAIRRVGSVFTATNETFGFINASYASHQFYANGNKLNYSDDDDREAVDLVNDEIIFSDDPISALIPSESALVVCTLENTYALLGAVGTTPDRWRGDDIHDDGCIAPMTARSYKGGAIWAGRRGIWYWNGADPVNLVGALGDAYQRIIEGMGAGTSAWSMVSHGHYYLHVESTTQTDFKSYGTATYESGTALTMFTIVVKLDTGAVSILRNVGIRGAAQPPPSVSSETYFGVTTLSGGTRTARVHKASDLLAENNATGIDTYTCDGESGTFPAWELETKKYDVGNPQLLKLFKMLLLHYNLWGSRPNDAADIAAETADHLRFATVKGLDTTGTLSGKKFFVNPSAQAWLDKRLKFMKRSQFLSVRMWQGTTTITRLQIGAWALGYKNKRPGRV